MNMLFIQFDCETASHNDACDFAEDRVRQLQSSVIRKLGKANLLSIIQFVPSLKVVLINM